MIKADDNVRSKGQTKKNTDKNHVRINKRILCPIMLTFYDVMMVNSFPTAACQRRAAQIIRGAHDGRRDPRLPRGPSTALPTPSSPTSSTSTKPSTTSRTRSGNHHDGNEVYFTKKRKSFEFSIFVHFFNPKRCVSFKNWLCVLSLNNWLELWGVYFSNCHEVMAFYEMMW